MTTPSPCSCIICRKLTSNLGITSHVSLAHSKEKTAFTIAGNKARTGKPAWNTGLKLSKLHCDKISAALSGREVKSSTRAAISLTAAKNKKSGGFRQGGGRGKKGKFKGIYCDSSWELAFLIFQLDQGKNIQRVNKPRFYKFDGKVRKYYPDFIIDEQVYEIKGWKTAQWDAKHLHNPDVIVLGWSEISPMIEYAKCKFGEDFTSAYE